MNLTYKQLQLPVQRAALARLWWKNYSQKIQTLQRSIKLFLPHLQARPKVHILNVSSMGGFLPVPGQSEYGTTNTGISQNSGVDIAVSSEEAPKCQKCSAQKKPLR